MSLPKTRAEAKALGAPHYFTGKLCKFGHTAPRTTKRGQCMECKNLHASSTWAERGAGNRRKRLYGIDDAIFAQLLAEQEHCCAICREPFEKSTPNVDHCHSSGTIRGMLCHLCNKGLGMFRDNPNLIRRAASYLEIETLKEIPKWKNIFSPTLLSLPKVAT